MRPSYISSLKNTTDVSVRFCNCECFLNLLLIMLFHRAPLSISLTLCIENICLKLLCEYYILNSDASILTNSSITFVPFSVNIAPATVPRHFLLLAKCGDEQERDPIHIFSGAFVLRKDCETISWQCNILIIQGGCLKMI